MRRKNIVGIMAMLQHLRAGASNNQIKRELKVRRHTARAYRQWAEEHGLLAGALPPLKELERLRADSFGLGQNNRFALFSETFVIMTILDNRQI